MQAENETCFWNHRLSDGSEGAVGGGRGGRRGRGRTGGGGGAPAFIITLLLGNISEKFGIKLGQY